MARKSLNYDSIIDYFKYESYYSRSILCDIADAMNIDTAKVYIKAPFYTQRFAKSYYY